MRHVRHLALLARSTAIVAAAAAALGAHACPPPPPSTPAERAQGFWNRVDNVCVVVLDRASLRRSSARSLEPYRSMATGLWRVRAKVSRTLKGRCPVTTVDFADISPALCGGGMPPLSTPLVAGWTAGRLMTVWTPAASDVANALEALAAQGAAAAASAPPAVRPAPPPAASPPPPSPTR